MTKTVIKDSKPMDIVTHKKISVPRLTDFSSKSLDELRNSLLTDVQGEAVEIMSTVRIPEAMLTFEILHKVCPEAVYQVEENLRILLYDHGGQKVLRDKDIISDFIDAHQRPGNQIEAADTLIIHIEKIYKNDSSTNELEKLTRTYAEITKKVKVCESLTLIGEQPTVLFLLAQHCSLQRAGELWYQRNEASESIRIR